MIEFGQECEGRIVTVTTTELTTILTTVTTEVTTEVTQTTEIQTTVETTETPIPTESKPQINWSAIGLVATLGALIFIGIGLSCGYMCRTQTGIPFDS